MSFTEHDSIACRADFPALSRRLGDHAIAYFDGPGGTQVPEPVLAAIRDSYVNRNANFDGAFETSRAVTAAVGQVRGTVADFLGAPSPDTIVSGNGSKCRTERVFPPGR